ncbi:MAG: hypothetical protein JW983_02390 [Elusimicrobia bacterium]|nr:hypothetical protein [Elusimicrobiota bacterium]
MLKQLKNGLNPIKRFVLSLIFLSVICHLSFVICLYSQSSISYPVYICAADNPNDYRLFANSGWDGFWYVGYNRVWIERVPIPENMSVYKKAFIGAKLGRMKSTQVYRNGKAALDKRAIPGDIYMAISSTISWQKSNWKFLAVTDEIPFEGDNEIAIEQTGESQWFWTEVPFDEINFGEENYIALWSTSAQLTDTSNSPILAAAWGNKEANSYLRDKIEGVPPQVFSTSTLASGLTIFEPAIAIKFVPEMPQKINIGLMGISDGEEISGKKVIYTSILGNEIQKAWLDVSSDGKIWEKHGLNIYTAPYIFSLNPKKAPFDSVSFEKEKSHKFYIRISAVDIWENTGTSTPISIFIVDPAR